MVTILGCVGWEPHANALIPVIYSTNRSTAQFSPRGGLCSAVLVSAAQADDRANLGSTNTPSDGSTHAYSFDFRLTSVAVDMCLAHADFDGGTAQSLKLYSDGFGNLGWFRQAGFGIAGPGSQVGIGGTFTLVANTWYRLWVSVTFNASTGDIHLESRIADAATDPAPPTDIDATFTDNSGNTSLNWGIGGNHGAATGATKFIDHVFRYSDVAYGSEHYGVCLGGSVSGIGTDNDMEWVNAGADVEAWQAVDEATPNGSGTTDVDYIRSNAITTEFNQSFQTALIRSVGYTKPVWLKVGLWHRNANIDKFAPGETRLRTYNNTVVANVGSIPDPATDSYLGGTLILNDVLDGNPEQLDGLQVGIHKGAVGAEAADWRISTFGLELGWLKAAPAPLPMTGTDIVAVRHRAMGF